jgi:glycosyltransferase involved in cell wall biosynthesis
MIVHAYYEEDPRVRRQAESLVAAGLEVDVLALRRPGDPPRAEIDGVRVRRLDVQRHQGAGLATYLLEYLPSSPGLARPVAPTARYGLVQVHTLPDFLVFAAMPLRLVGVPVLLDLHEAMPEFFRSRFPGAANPLAHRLLLVQERLSIGAATAVVTVNDALRDRLAGLRVPAAKLNVIPNSPALARFDPAAHPARAFRADGTLRLVYAGAVTPTYELDVALRAVALIARTRPDVPVAFEVYGRGDSADTLRAMAAELGLADRVVFHGRIPIEEVPAAIARADIGLAPTRRDRFTDVSLSTKIYEYAAMGGRSWRRDCRSSSAFRPARWPSGRAIRRPRARSWASTTCGATRAAIAAAARSRRPLGGRPHGLPRACRAPGGATPAGVDSAHR